MEKKKKQIVIVVTVAALILAAAIIIIAKDADFCYVDNSSVPDIPPIEKERIDTLEVTDWSGGPKSASFADMPPVNIPFGVQNSVLIVSATVAESKEWWNTPDGKPWQSDPQNPKPGENPFEYYDKECYLDVNDVLKGDFEMYQIFLRTNVMNSDFKEGTECILFIDRSEQSGNYYYSICSPVLLKTGSSYQGKGGATPLLTTYDELKNEISKYN
jgi:hypothetical protein